MRSLVFLRECRAPCLPSCAGRKERRSSFPWILFWQLRLSLALEFPPESFRIFTGVERPKDIFVIAYGIMSVWDKDDSKVSFCAWQVHFALGFLRTEILTTRRARGSVRCRLIKLVGNGAFVECLSDNDSEDWAVLERRSKSPTSSSVVTPPEAMILQEGTLSAISL